MGVIAAVLLSGCAAHSPNTPDFQRCSSQASEVARSQGAVLLLHGLNNKPEIMEPWGKLFRQSGFDTVTVALRGHAPGESLADVLPSEWIADASAGLTELLRRGGREKPLFAVCYSLGCTALFHALNDAPDISPTLRGIVAFAPAVELTRRTVFLRLLLPLRHLGVALPSFSPPAIRVHSLTPLQAFHGVFSLVDEVRPVNVPVLAFVSEGDELVKSSALSKWFGESGEVHVLPDFAVKPTTEYKHLIVDPAGLENGAATGLKRRVAAFLTERASQ